jgi:hypothetical protein
MQEIKNASTAEHASRSFTASEKSFQRASVLLLRVMGCACFAILKGYDKKVTYSKNLLSNVLNIYIAHLSWLRNQALSTSALYCESQVSQAATDERHLELLLTPRAANVTRYTVEEVRFRPFMRLRALSLILD